MKRKILKNRIATGIIANIGLLVVFLAATVLINACSGPASTSTNQATTKNAATTGSGNNSVIDLSTMQPDQRAEIVYNDTLLGTQQGLLQGINDRYNLKVLKTMPLVTCKVSFDGSHQHAYEVTTTFPVCEGAAGWAVDEARRENPNKSTDELVKSNKLDADILNLDYLRLEAIGFGMYGYAPQNQGQHNNSPLSTSHLYNMNQLVNGDMIATYQSLKLDILKHKTTRANVDPLYTITACFSITTECPWFFGHRVGPNPKAAPENEQEELGAVGETGTGLQMITQETSAIETQGLSSYVDKMPSLTTNSPSVINAQNIVQVLKAGTPIIGIGGLVAAIAEFAHMRLQIIIGNYNTAVNTSGNTDGYTSVIVGDNNCVFN